MTREFVIAGRRIADDTEALICAEIGHNHQGSVETCKAMFKAAAEAGATAVKLQKRDNSTLFTRAAYDAPYTSDHSFGPTYGAHREALEFGWDEYVELQDYAESLGLVFFATAFDVPSADFLARLGVPAIKIASGDLRSIPLLRHVAGLGLLTILSTGGGSLADVERAVETVPWRPGQLCILQCTAAYPVQPEEMNLRVITTYRERFPDIVIGLSDHFSGIFTGPLSYLLGARFIEKHFTTGHAMKGSDHAFSLEPNGLRRLVRDMQRTPLVLGDGLKWPYESEARSVVKMQKSLVAATDLPAGHVLTAADLAMKSPGGGLPPYRLPDFVGRTLRAPLAADEMLSEGALP